MHTQSRVENAAGGHRSAAMIGARRHVDTEAAAAAAAAAAATVSGAQ